MAENDFFYYKSNVGLHKILTAGYWDGDNLFPFVGDATPDSPYGLGSPVTYAEITSSAQPDVYGDGSEVIVREVAATADIYGAGSVVRVNQVDQGFGGTYGTGSEVVVEEVSDTLAGFTLVLDEQFTGTAVDTNRWHIENSTYGQANNRVGRYTPGNVVVSGGTCKMICRNAGDTLPDGGSNSRWTGGMLSTRDVGVFYPKFCRIEARGRVHHGHGIWPAVWLRHRSGSSECEPDIMEYFHGQLPGFSTGALHRRPSAGAGTQVNAAQVRKFMELPTAEGAQGWHTWAIDILPEGSNVRFLWYLDGELMGSFLDTQSAYWSSLHPGQPVWDIALQGAQIGGDWAGHPDDPLGGSRWIGGSGGCMIGGSYPNCSTSYQGATIRRSEVSSVSPGTEADVVGLELDYVRVWEYTG